MKKIIWIDVGTHFAQEHSSLFGSNSSFYLHILKRFIGGKLLRRGKFVGLKDLRNIISFRSKIRKSEKDFFTVFIDANPKIFFRKKNYLNANLAFNLALTSNSSLPFSITKLYLGNREEFSQGSSIFLEKENVHKDSYFSTLSLSAEVFFKELKKYLDEKFKDYDVLLRVNCEGVEDDVIYSAHKNFENKLKFICGALKDVEDIKGSLAYNNLNSYLIENKLIFEVFHSRIDSWKKAYAAILNLIENRK